MDAEAMFWEGLRIMGQVMERALQSGFQSLALARYIDECQNEIRTMLNRFPQVTPEDEVQARLMQVERLEVMYNRLKVMIKNCEMVIKNRERTILLFVIK
jgi:5-methylcytosine-specific restriction endonuclease McrBC regulatory subunit McrC